MLTQLVESMPRAVPPSKRIPAAMLSVSVHAVALFLGVQLTAGVVPPSPPPSIVGPPIMLPPPTTARPRRFPEPAVPAPLSGAPLPAVDSRTLPPLVVPTGIPPVDLTEPPIAIDRRGVYAPVGTIFGSASASPGIGRPFRVSLVDEAPERVTAPTLRYPELLLGAGIEGMVLIEVVIDTAGKPEPESLAVISSTHRAFTAAASEAILASRYHPGRIGGRPVRVLVRLPVRFVIERHGG